MSKSSKSFIGLTSGLAIVGMAAGFQVAASAHTGDVAVQTIAASSTSSTEPSPRPTVYQTIHPTITASPVAADNSATAPVDSGTTTVNVPVQQQTVTEAAPVQAAPVQAEPAPAPVTPPAPVVQPPATTTGAS